MEKITIEDFFAGVGFVAVLFILPHFLVAWLGF